MQIVIIIMLFIKLNIGITINYLNFKIMKKIVLLISIVTIVYGFSGVDDNHLIAERLGLLESKFGVWEGTGSQLGMSWTIKITFNSNEQLIEYPSLGCSGFLTLLDETNKQLLFRETITSNTACFDQGFVELIETSETTMDYNFYFPNAENEKGKLGASGSVKRIE